jgi:hypothetical protein
MPQKVPAVPEWLLGDVRRDGGMIGHVAEERRTFLARAVV